MNKYLLMAVVAILAIAILRRRGESTSSPDRDLPHTEGDIDRLITAGRKIDAIKAYRHLHGGELKDAKDAVEARAKQLPKGGMHG